MMAFLLPAKMCVYPPVAFGHPPARRCLTRVYIISDSRAIPSEKIASSDTALRPRTNNC